MAGCNPKTVRFFLFIMPTFFERLQAYYQKPNSFKFSKKRIRNLHSGISVLWNRQHKNQNIDLPLIESIESEDVFMVRLYPDTYTKTIDGCILKAHNGHLAALETEKQHIENAAKKVLKKQPPPKIIKPTKERKRIPANRKII